MISINLKEICRLRGVKNPLTTLRKAGISHYVAHEYLKGRKDRFVTAHIEILCRLLRCTPNDLFVWTPDQPADDYPENPLQAIRQRSRPDIQALLGNMSVAEIEEMLNERKKEEGCIG